MDEIVTRLGEREELKELGELLEKKKTNREIEMEMRRE